jgi:hypothetical protein
MFFHEQFSFFSKVAGLEKVMDNISIFFGKANVDDLGGIFTGLNTLISLFF